MEKDLLYYENLHNTKFPKKLIKVIKIKENYIYFETEFGLCKKKVKDFKERSFDLRSAINKTDFFIRKSNKLFNKKYNYSKVIYLNAKKKVIITCKIHGDFEQTPNKHLSREGCYHCGRIKTTEYQKKYGVGNSIEYWNEKGLKSKTFDSFKCYIIKCWNEDEEFYKIGRTFNKVTLRFKSKGHIPYSYTIVKLFTGSSEDMFNLELNLKQINKENQYTPLLIFGGSTECFSKIKQIN